MSQSTSQPTNRQRGVALLFCIFALLILTAITTSLILLSGTETSVNYNYRTEEVSFFAAKAGLYEALDRMQLTNASLITVPTVAPSATGGVLYLINPGASLTVQPWNTSNAYYDDEFCHEGFTIAGMTSAPPDIPCTTIPSGTTWRTTATSNYPWSGTSTAIPYEWVRVNWKANQSVPYLSTTTTGGVTMTTTSYYSVNSSGAATTGVCWNGASEVLVSPANTSTTGCKAMEGGTPPSLATPVYVVTALAVTSNGSRQMVQAEVALPPPPIFQEGFFVTSTTCSSSGGGAPFVLSGGALVDGFNSSSGTYTATKSNSLGSIGSNGSILESSGGTTVGGTIYVPNTAVNGTCPTSDVFATGGATYGGVSALSGGAYNPPTPSIPTNTSTTDESVGSNQTLPPGNYRNITVSGSGVKLTLTAPGTFNVNCLNLSGGSILAISPATSQVIINVTGNSCSGSTPINLSGGSVSNAAGTAGNLMINYAGTQAVKLSGGSASYMVANTPNAAVTMSGGSDFYGAIIGKTINDSGGTSLHFDSSLNSSPSSTSSYQTLAFRSLPY